MIVRKGDKLALWNLKDGVRPQIIPTHIQVGDKGLLMGTQDKRKFYCKTPLRVGDKCRIYSLVDKLIAKGWGGKEALVRADLRLWQRFGGGRRNRGWGFYCHGYFREDNTWKYLWGVFHENWWGNTYDDCWARYQVSGVPIWLGRPLRFYLYVDLDFWHWLWGGPPRWACWDGIELIPEGENKNIIQNGSFEDGLNHWQHSNLQEGYDQLEVRCDENAKDGQCYLWEYHSDYSRWWGPGDRFKIWQEIYV